MPLSETFLITLTTTSSATFLVCLRWLYRSKCTRIQCCGLIVERDVHEEGMGEHAQSPENNSQKIERTITL